MPKCKYCPKATGHSTKNCPKAPKEESTGGRGLTKATKADGVALEVCLLKLDPLDLYGSGAKSLVGGRKGKPSGLDDTSYRIDRQFEGNVQFQKDGDSLGKVTFSQDDLQDAIIQGLRHSVAHTKEVEI
jgi:hypothetical protein